MEILLGKAHARTGTQRLADSRWVVLATPRFVLVPRSTLDQWAEGNAATTTLETARQWGCWLRFVTSSILNGGNAQPCGRLIGGRVVQLRCADAVQQSWEKGACDKFAPDGDRLPTCAPRSLPSNYFYELPSNLPTLSTF